VIENGSRYNLAGLGYFFKDESIQFVFDPPLFTIEGKNTIPEREEENVAGEEQTPLPESRKTVVVISISACLLIVVAALVILLRLSGSTDLSDPLISLSTPSESQFVIIDSEENDIEITPLPNLNYHVIAGCFEEKLNAENFVLQCKTQGYDKSEILLQIGLLYPVSIGNFATYTEALNKKKEYDEKYDEETWIYRVKN
jgi:hypothetical protein